MKRFVAITVLALVSAVASAAWVDAGSTADQQKIKLDSERYQRQGDAVTAAIRVEYPAPQIIPFSPKSYVAAERIYHFQCANKQFILASAKMLDKDGGVAYEFDAAKNPFGGTPQPQSVPSEKTGDRLAFEAACAYKKP